MHTSELGRTAERMACQFLLDKGYEILARNWQKPWGELDIVAQKDGVISFVEVKAADTIRDGFSPEMHVTPDKIRKLVRTAQTYLAAKKYAPDQEYRIDVISIVMNAGDKGPRIRHFENIDTENL